MASVPSSQQCFHHHVCTALLKAGAKLWCADLPAGGRAALLSCNGQILWATQAWGCAGHHEILPGAEPPCNVMWAGGEGLVLFSPFCESTLQCVAAVTAKKALPACCYAWSVWYGRCLVLTRVNQGGFHPVKT